jgi:hypothetical protein
MATSAGGARNRDQRIEMTASAGEREEDTHLRSG